MFKICLLLYLYVISINSKRILSVFPMPSVSHQVVFRPVMQELAKRGHEVTVITTDPAFPRGGAPENLTEIDVHDISYQFFDACFKSKILDGGAFDIIRVGLLCAGILFEKQIKSPEVLSLINDKTNKFDLIFIESVSRPSLGFVYLYDVPVIEFSSLAGQFDVYESVGAATQPFLYPLPIQQRIINLSLWDKILELYKRFTCYNTYYKLEKDDYNMLKRIFGPDIPEIKELRKNLQMSFLNVHPIWDSNRPVPPNVVYLGGLHQKPPKPLPKDIQSYLDSSVNGVVYVSFGTNVEPSLFSIETIKIFTTVFSKLPYDFLVKWDNEELPERPKNVKISKWFPQPDLLRHPKIKLFITQGGLQSTDEAITAGVPLIGIPILWDQWFNVERYIKHNIGMGLDLKTLSEDDLTAAIKTVIDNNQSYRDSVAKLRNIIQDQPQTPLERAVWWTEYVLRHGSAAHLMSPAANMHWTEYYEIKLILFLSGIFIAAIILIITVIQCVIVKFKNNFVKIKLN